VTSLRATVGADRVVTCAQRGCGGRLGTIGSVGGHPSGDFYWPPTFRWYPNAAGVIERDAHHRAGSASAPPRIPGSGPRRGLAFAMPQLVRCPKCRAIQVVGVAEGGGGPLMLASFALGIVMLGLAVIRHFQRRRMS